nr:MAG TPA: hypothetical protein [Herelleviridae sp.]
MYRLILVGEMSCPTKRTRCKAVVSCYAKK